MKDTSECVGCKSGALIKTDKAPKYYIQCSLKNKRYPYGQMINCADFNKK